MTQSTFLEHVFNFPHIALEVGVLGAVALCTPAFRTSVQEVWVRMSF